MTIDKERITKENITHHSQGQGYVFHSFLLLIYFDLTSKVDQVRILVDYPCTKFSHSVSVQTNLYDVNANFVYEAISLRTLFVSFVIASTAKSC